MAVKVLILEDNSVARSFLCKVVRESFSDDLEIVESSDLESARREIQLAQAGNPFRLYLIDLELPDGSGMELLQELNRAPGLKIVSTLYSDDEHLFPALQLGAGGYLLKEDRFEVLVEELQRIVRGQPPLSPAIARRLLGHFRPGSSGDSGPMGLNSGFGSFSSASRPTPLDPADDANRLSARENEVLTYLSKGFTVKEIANLMGVKWFTVNDHIKAIYRKLSLSSRADAKT
ncbi:MAG: response regulator transcription factor [Inhella sp.]